MTRRRVALSCAVLLLAPVAVLVVWAALTPLPSALGVKETPSLRLMDRNGAFILEARRRDGEFIGPVRLSEVGQEVVVALLAAEDARFFSHPGIDPLAVVRAVGQLFAEGEIVSGASTLTQQLARTLVPRPRTVRGKLAEMALALRLEASLSKEQILEEYLSRVAFGTNVRGIDAASRLYFDKPPSRLSLAEAAALVSIPRGPSMYDPRRGTARVLSRRNRVLERLRDRGLWDEEGIRRALAEPLALRPRHAEEGAPHFVRTLASGKLEPWLFQHESVREIVSTLDLALQREVETLARQTASRVTSAGASAVSVVVVDNASAEVLAYVGSPDFWSEPALGQNDGARALRQPGSTLKPFVYAAAMHHLGLTAASLLPDVELHLPTVGGTYSPSNYDGRFHGPTRLRVALGNSFNVPAVHTASRLGPERVLALLHALGFSSLTRGAAHYGPAIALGDGEVRLTELAAAYATLARGGSYLPLRFSKEATLTGGERVQAPPRSAARVIDPRIAAVLTDVLSDPSARLAAFGRGSALALPFPAAVKTGTSKAFRDNLTVGYTRELTVAVWVGNFDGSPMLGSTGVTGAAPLFREVLMAAQRGRSSAPLFDSAALVETAICPETGERPGPHCSHSVRERFLPGTEPRVGCSLHEPAAPIKVSAPVVVYPPDGTRYVFDPSLADAQQQIVFRARASEASPSIRFVVDGRDVGCAKSSEGLPWSLVRGRHEVRAVAGERMSAPVIFEVR